MVAISRIRVAWSGSGVIGPGVSTFYTDDDPAALQTACITLFNDIKPAFPSSVSWTIPATGEIIDSDDGEATGVWSSGSVGTASGTSASGFASGVGMRCVWATNGLTNGRRVRGTTYFVPMGSPNFDTDGTPIAGSRQNLQDSCDDFVSTLSGSLSIYTRPHPDPDNPEIVLNGAVHNVLSALVPDKVSWLRSRRT